MIQSPGFSKFGLAMRLVEPFAPSETPYGASSVDMLACQPLPAHQVGVSNMTRSEHDKLLTAAVAQLEEAARLLKKAEEEVLSQRATELADLVDVLRYGEVEAA